jgi:hypothetical protein
MVSTMTEGTTQKRGPASVRPWVVISLTAICLLLGISAVVVIAVYKPMVRERVIAEARARGVELEVGEVEVWFGSLTLKEARFGLVGVKGVEGRAERIDVLLDGLRPTRAALDELTMEITRPAPELFLDLEAWARKHPPREELPVSASDVTVVWRSVESAAPWLSVRGGTASHSKASTAFGAGEAVVAGTAVRNVGASWTETDAQLSVALGSSDPRDATISIRVNRTTAPIEAVVTLAPTPLTTLAGPLDLPLPMRDVIASGKAELAIPPVLGTGSVRGHVDGILDGFTPPHPIELSGFDFGKATTLSTDFQLSPTYDRVDLTETHVQAGDFGLRGGGTITRHDDHAVLELTLRGNLSCKVIARSAAQARLGSVLGKVLGKAAHRVLEGSVAVTLDITADSRRPAEPRIEPRIGIGCGLRPLTLTELADLGIDSASELALGMGVPPEIVDRARGAAAKVPTLLPPLPSSLPSLPSALALPSSLPRLPFEIRKKDDDSKRVDGD